MNACAIMSRKTTKRLGRDGNSVTLARSPTAPPAISPDRIVWSFGATNAETRPPETAAINPMGTKYPQKGLKTHDPLNAETPRQA